MSKRFLLFLILAFHLSASYSFAQNVKVERVIDGDTLLLRVDGQLKVSALYGVDAPEEGQPYAEEAKKFIEGVLLKYQYKTKITIKEEGLASSGKRDVASCELHYQTSTALRNLATIMISDGFAFYDRRIDPNYSRNSMYINSEKMAKKYKQGFWAKGNPEFPWVYRRNNNVTEVEYVAKRQKYDKLGEALGNATDGFCHPNTAPEICLMLAGAYEGTNPLQLYRQTTREDDQRNMQRNMQRTMEGMEKKLDQLDDKTLSESLELRM